MALGSSIKTSVSFALAVGLFVSFDGNPLRAQAKKPEPPKKVVSRGISANSRDNIDIAPLKPVTPVNPQLLTQVKATAAKIDELIEGHLEYLQMKPNPVTRDATFVRRIYLDVTGTIPTYEQAKSFIDSREPDKREKLIDELLNSHGYVSHMYNYWANILRITDRPQNNVIGEPYVEWVKDQIRENRPYDKWVNDMLSAEGKIWDNPAVGYTLTDGDMPLDAMDNTVRVFLGTQIGCAQCHDHPFDKWKQKEFYQLAAYTYGTKTRRGGINLNNLREELKKIDPKNNGGGTFSRLVRAQSYDVWENKNQSLTLPHDYKYDDAKPKAAVTPSPIFGQLAEVKPGESKRKAFADWLTSADNPRFSGAIANRLWKHVMGAGLVEPVDDVRDDSRPENLPLMGLLVSELKRLDFDLKEYLRILYNTRTYQRQSTLASLSDAEVYHFPGPMLRRMTAEQVWDSFLTLAIYNPDSIQRPTTKGMDKVAYLDPKTVNAKKVLAQAEEFEKLYGRDATAQMRKDTYYKGLTLARASELPQPLPADHFLRQFGQGDRELISGASTEGTVPQILTMFNGAVTHMMLEKGSVIFDNVTGSKGIGEGIDIIFLSVLGRYPTSEEREISFSEIQRAKAAGFGNVIWALVNTREFLFIE